MSHFNRQSWMLLIVDPQIDFINGSLPVSGAVKAMDDLADYVNSHGDHYKCIVVTCDRHNIRHSSFKDFGGLWPAHCVESSVGAAVWPSLMEALERHSDKVTFLYKGENSNHDEYSIFGSENGRHAMYDIIRNERIGEIDICGLAGDVCVATTLTDALNLHPEIKFHILKSYTASLDEGKKVDELSEELASR